MDFIIYHVIPLFCQIFPFFNDTNDSPSTFFLNKTTDDPKGLISSVINQYNKSD